MPRTYHRKTDNGLVPHAAMLEAVTLVVNGMSTRKAAKEKGISKLALCRYVKKHGADCDAILAPNYRHSQVFTSEQEKSLEE